jgi:hypothetical protein
MAKVKNVLSKLKKLDLRQVWKHEALDFTNWLAEKDNLEALSEAVGVDIKLIETEASVGKFNVDILAEEDLTGKKIIIENQLEATDHDHLGKIITYASGHDAEIIIWIVKDTRDEHQKAIEWLNDHTDDDTSFFLIRIELWQIDDSKPAPKFEIVVSPNEWAKAIKANPSKKGLTNTKLQQLDFWNKLKEYIHSQSPNMKLRTPGAHHWYDISIGSSDCHIALTMNTRENLLGCEIYINRNKELFHHLIEQKESIEKAIGESVEWVDAAKASRIKISTEVDDLFSESEITNNFTWLLSKIVLFQKVFSTHIKTYKNG